MRRGIFQMWLISNWKLLIAGAGLVTLLFMGAYIRILKAENEIQQSQLDNALQMNQDWNIAWDNIEEELEESRKQTKEVRAKYIKIEQDFNKLRLKQEKHDYAKIMEKKPGTVSRTIINSTNRMFRADESRTQTYYNKKTRTRTSKTAPSNNASVE